MSSQDLKKMASPRAPASSSPTSPQASTSSASSSSNAGSSAKKPAKQGESEEDDRTMPNPEELERRFLAVVEEMALPEDKKKQFILSVTSNRNKKWELVRLLEKAQSEDKDLEEDMDSRESPKRMAHELLTSPTIALLHSLSILLRSKPVYWVSSFLKFNGMEGLTRLLAATVSSAVPPNTELLQANTNDKSKTTRARQASSKNVKKEQGPNRPTPIPDGDVQFECIGCFRALLNTLPGMTAFLESKDTLRSLALVLDSSISSLRARTQACFLLALICHYSDEGFFLVLDGFNHYRLVKRETVRFADIVRSLNVKPASGSSIDFDELTKFLTSALMLINALVHVPNELFLSLQLDDEFMGLGVLDSITQIRTIYLQSMPQDQNAASAPVGPNPTPAELLAIQARILEEALQKPRSSESDTLANISDVREAATLLQAQLGGNAVLYSKMVSILRQLLRISTKKVDEKSKQENFRVLESMLKKAAENFTIEDEMRLQNRVLTQQATLTDLESRITRERNFIQDFVQKMRDAQDPPSPPQEFELLKDLYKLLLEIRTTSPSFFSGPPAVAPSKSDTAAVAPSSPAPLSIPAPPSPPAPPTPPSSAALKSIPSPPLPPSQQNDIPISPPSPPNAVLPPPPSDFPPPPPPLSDIPPPPPPALGADVPPPPPPPELGADVPPPPPGPFAPGPPPPPGAPRAPGGFGGISLPKLTVVKPTKPTKQVHYIAVPKSKLAKSIWIEMHVAERTNAISLDTSELEHLFSSRSDEVVVDTSKTDSTSGSRREKKISLLDPKRTHSVGIQLASLRPILPTFADIKTAIMTTDEHRLKIGTIAILKSIVPTQEEVGLVSSYSGDIKQLDDPDRFFLEVHHIPYVAERLETWHFMIKFNTDIAETRPDVETLVLAAKELVESKKLPELLALILAVGNFLNANSAKRDCYGFKMPSLLKLKDTKTVDNQSNLLEYIAKIAQANHPTLLNFAETELAHVSLAKKVGLSTIRDSVINLKKGIKLVESLSERYQSLPQQLPGDEFLEKMEKFIASSKEQVDQLETRIVKLADTIETVAELFDEDKSALKQAPEQFFELIDTFCEQFREAHRKNVERVELEKQRLKKEKDLEDRRKGQAKAAAVIKKPGAEKGFLDNLESSLMNGSGFRAPRARAATEGTSLAKP